MLAIEIHLFPDKTFFIQLGLFLAVFVALNFLIFKPVLRILRYRFEKTVGDRKKIEELTKKTEKLMGEYEAKISDARTKAHELKDAIQKEGVNQAAQLMHEARTLRQRELEKVRQEVAKAEKEAEGRLEAQAQELGREIAEKALRKGM